MFLLENLARPILITIGFIVAVTSIFVPFAILRIRKESIDTNKKLDTLINLLQN